jgi:hypothetical protein
MLDNARMPPKVPTAALRRLLRRTLWSLAILLLVGVAGFAYVTIIGITVDA